MRFTCWHTSSGLSLYMSLYEIEKGPEPFLKYPLGYSGSKSATGGAVARVGPGSVGVIPGGGGFKRLLSLITERVGSSLFG